MANGIGLAASILDYPSRLPGKRICPTADGRNSVPYIFNLQVDFGLLLCADALISFYEKLDWYQAKSRTFYAQVSGKIHYDSNTLLLAPQGAEHMQPTSIDLNGLPWSY